MSLNKVLLIGRLGKDPELRVTSSQMPVANFSLATNERRKDQSGNWNEHTEWHNIVTFGKTAENCSQYIKKGSLVYIEGAIHTRKWQDKEGKDRYTTEITANSVQFLESKNRTSTGSTTTGDGQVEKISYEDTSSVSSKQVMNSLSPADDLSTSKVSTPPSSGAALTDDDIPF
jgi:single-strand DNA-binding protein